MILWLVFLDRPQRQGMAPRTEHIGYVRALDREAALERAAHAFDAAPLSVVSQASWRLATKREKQMYLGTYVAPTEARCAEGRRISLCKMCGGEIVTTLPAGKKKWGRPPQYHESCAPDSVKRFRKYGKKRRRGNDEATT